jgi:hypothetical protein
MSQIRLGNFMKQSTRILVSTLIGVVSLLSGATVASSQSDIPTAEMLDAMFPVLRHKQSPPLPLQISLTRATDRAKNPSCGLVPLNLVETKGNDTHTFKLLGAPESEQNAQPTVLLISLQRLTVDADGSRRTYHPEDPFGRGVCDRRTAPGRPENSVCALDNLGNAGIRVFEGAQRIPLFRKAGGNIEPNPDFANVWARVWAEIADRQPHWVDLNALFGQDAPSDIRLYYSKQSNAAAIFDSAIIPFKDGVPCQHEAGARHEYFVAATTPVPNVKSDPKQDACSTSSYLDSTQVPFFVLPGGVFQYLHVGDVVVAIAKVNDADRLVFGVVGDTGPNNQIGEGSILFARKLRRTDAEPKNSVDLGNLDIKVQNSIGMISSLAILVLGGTAKDVGGNYSAENIEKVGGALLTKWTNTLPGRLRTCADAATANPLDGFEGTGPN